MIVAVTLNLMPFDKEAPVRYVSCSCCLLSLNGETLILASEFGTKHEGSIALCGRVSYRTFQT